MQVAAVISGGKITDVKVLQTTTSAGVRSQISNQADPMLRSEVLQAQSAKVSTIGGATYTSEGYLQSAAVGSRPGRVHELIMRATFETMGTVVSTRVGGRPRG